MKFLVVFAFVLLFAVVYSDFNEDSEWELFKTQHNKRYKNDATERAHRKIWADNVRSVIAHNLKYDKGLETYKRKVNKFSDLTDDEFKSRNLGHLPGSLDD